MKNAKQHIYILVWEDGRIETPTLIRKPPKPGQSDLAEWMNQYIGGCLISGQYIKTKPHLDKPDVVIFWDDEGSLNGMKRNPPVSNLLGYMVYGPCLFAQNTVNSAGLKPEQFDGILSALRNTKDPTQDETIAKIETVLSSLEPVSEENYRSFDLSTFHRYINSTHPIYGFIRQLPDERQRKSYIKRVNSIRKVMRSACTGRADNAHVTIGYSPEELEGYKG